MVFCLSLTGDFSCEQADMGEEEPCGGAGNGGFEILGEASASAEPGEGSFHHPAAGQEFKPAGGVGALDDLNGPVADFGEATFEFGAGITAVSEHTPQPGIQGFYGFEHGGRPIAVLNAGMMNDGTDEVADCIRDDVALASLDLLSGIEPARAAGFGGLDRLTVDHASCGRSLASGHFPRCHDQGVIDAIERSIATEAVKIPLHGRERCEFLRDLPPLAPSRQHVEDGLHHHPQRHRSGPASMRWLGHEGFDQGPFGIGEVACVTQSGPAVSLPSDFSPGHRISVRPCKQTESQPTEIVQLPFSVQLSDKGDRPWTTLSELVVATGVAVGSAADLTLGHLATDVIFRAVGMERDFWVALHRARQAAAERLCRKF